MPGYSGVSCEKKAYTNKLPFGRMFLSQAFSYRLQGSNETIKPDQVNITNACLTQGCLNNGSCVRIIRSPAMITAPIYVCKCPPFFDGPLCEHRIPKSACEPNPCIYKPLVECRLLDFGNFDCVCPNNTDCLGLRTTTTIQTTVSTTVLTTTTTTTTTSTSPLTKSTTTSPPISSSSKNTTKRASVTFATSKYSSKGKSLYDKL